MTESEAKASCRRRAIGYAALARRTAVVVGTTLAIIALAAMLWGYPQVPFLAFAAVLIAVAIDAAVTPLRTRIGMPRVLSVLLVVAAISILSVVGIWLTAPRVSDQTTRLLEQVPRALDRATDWLASQGWAPSDRGALQGWSTERLTRVVSDWWATVVGALATTASFLGGVLLVIVAAVFLVIDPDLYRNGALQLIAPRSRERADEILQRMTEALRWWLAGRLAAMLAVAVLTQLGLWVLGSELSFILSVIAGLLTFIPFIGPITAWVPAVIVALAEDPRLALWVTALYFAVQLIENNLLTPLIQQRAVSLPPVVLIFAQLWLGLVFGMLGVLFASPVTVVAMIAVQKLYIEGTLGEEPSG